LNLQQQLKQIEAKLKSKYIPSAMQTEVAWASKTTMQKHLIEDVYNVYDSQYENKYHMGGLLDLENIETKMIDNNTLRIENIRKDEESGRLVAPVIESGIGYYNSHLDKLIGARPFVERTADELRSGVAREALRKGLIRNGLDIK